MPGPGWRTCAALLSAVWSAPVLAEPPAAAVVDELRLIAAEAGGPRAGPPGDAGGGSPAGGGGAEGLAERFTDPTALLTSYQFLTWYSPGVYGTRSGTTEFLFRPVLPVPKNDLIPFDQIYRVTAPVVASPDGPDGRPLPSGFGDTQLLQLAIFPVGESLRVGVGTGWVVPTATADATGQGKLQLGPAVLGLYDGLPKWQLGLLLQNPISVAGPRGREDVCQLVYQPIVVRHFEDGWYATFFSTIGTADWRSGEWTAPFSVGVGRVFAVARQLVSVSVQPTYYVGPDLAPQWQVQFNLALIYP